jgi:hypothetical protein
MTQVSGIEVRFSGNTADLEKSVGRAQGAISTFAKTAAASLAGALSVGMFVAAGNAAINYADKIDEMSEKVGMAAEELSALSYAAKVNGVSMDQLQTGLTMLIRSMGQGAEKFDALGVSIYESNGQLRSANDVLIDVAQKFSEMEDGVGKSQWALELFGRSGLNLIPVLNLGAKGLADATEEARLFGRVISGETARNAAKFNDNMTRMNEVANGLAQDLMRDLVPHLNDVLEVLLNLERNGSGISGAVKGIATEFGDLARVVTTSAEKLSQLHGWYKAIDEIARKYGPMSGAAQNGFFGMFPENAMQDPTGSLASIDNFNPQSVNRDGKGDLQLAKPPRLDDQGNGGGVDDGLSPVPGIPGVDEIDPFFIDRLAAIQEGFKSEREVLEEEYAANRDVLRNALMNGLIPTQEEYQRISEDLEKQHQDNLAAIRQNAMDVQLNAASSLFGSLAQLMDGGNKKMMKLSKAFSAAQVVINTAQGISKAFAQFGWPAGIGPAAAVAASGAAQLASIASAESGKIKGVGGGGGRGGGGGAASAGGAAGGGGGPTTTFQFTLMNDPMGFGEKFARQFIDQLNSTQRNGGQIRGVIA